MLGVLIFFLCLWCKGESFEFVNKDFSEIFYAVSLFKGFPVTADDTVRGNGDFRVSGEDFDNAFDSFLIRSRLYVKKNSQGWTVSRYKITKDKNGLYALDAYDMSPAQLLEKTAVETGICITYDSLPNISVSIHTNFCGAEEVVSRICGLCNGFELEKKDDSHLHIARSAKNQNQFASGKAIFLENEKGLWDCDIQNSSLDFVLEKLFRQASKQFCIISGGEGKIVRISLKNMDLHALAEQICAQSGAQIVFKNDAAFVFSSKSARKRLDETGRLWKKDSLKYNDFEKFSSAALKRFSDVELIKIENGKDFFYCIKEEDEKDFRDFLVSWDVERKTYLVKLNNIRTSDFFAALPPFVDKNKVFDSGKGDSFYFTGSKEEFESLENELTEYDKPVTCVSYDLLIIQYQNSEQSEWNPSVNISSLSDNTKNNLTASLGTVLDFNMDVLGAFGLKFAADLQASINETKARVFADTTLNGVSGRTINFQNTNTYRYRDNNLDPDTGKPIYSGVTREIVSGLKLEITGSVTGDKMVTTKITASVSRQGVDTSSKTGNPPPSSEKVVSTEVRAKSGEPVVLSGLVQKEESSTNTRIPWFSKIPVLGWMFKGQTKVDESTELVIYLVPNVQNDNKESEKNTQQKKIEEKKNKEINEKKEIKRLLREFEIL